MRGAECGHNSSSFVSHVLIDYGNSSVASAPQRACIEPQLHTLAMAEQETSNHSDAPRVDSALPLLDFDWKLKYAVASGSIASVNKPLLRLELYVAKSLSKVEEAGIGRVLPENQIQAPVAEFTRAQLDTLIDAMSAIELALEGAESAT